jgi:hypothetical protein
MNKRANFGKRFCQIFTLLGTISLRSAQNGVFLKKNWGQRPVVPLLLLGPPIFLIILFLTTTLLIGMTGISCHPLARAMLGCQMVCFQNQTYQFR